MSKYEIIGREWAAKHGKMPAPVGFQGNHWGWYREDKNRAGCPATLPRPVYDAMQTHRSFREFLTYDELGRALDYLRGLVA